jgi:hypothetical protein
MTKVHLQDPLAGQAAQSEEIERLRNAIEQWKLEEQDWYEQLAEAKRERDEAVRERNALGEAAAFAHGRLESNSKGCPLPEHMAESLKALADERARWIEVAIDHNKQCAQLQGGPAVTTEVEHFEVEHLRAQLAEANRLELATYDAIRNWKLRPDSPLRVSRWFDEGGMSAVATNLCRALHEEVYALWHLSPDDCGECGSEEPEDAE